MAKKVLYIEDSPVDARMVKELLEKEGFIVQVAASGKEGLEKAKQMQPDLILLDLILPDIDGFGVCSAIRKDISLAKSIIIVLSVKDNMEDINKILSLGADDYIIKPPLPDFIIKKIKLYLGGRP